MPLLAGLFSSWFAAIAGFFAAHMSKKAAFAAAAVATFAILTTAFLALIATSVNAVLSSVTLPYGVRLGMAIFMPANLDTCIAAIIAAHVAKGLYDWNVENLRLASYVT